MQGKKDRSAHFEDALAIGYPDGSSKAFTVKSHGSIALVEDVENTKWPVNSLFIPAGYDIALGSMSDEDQTKYWGDGNWPKLIEYLNSLS